jgi:hypothetical protein
MRLALALAFVLALSSGSCVRGARALGALIGFTARLAVTAVAAAAVAAKTAAVVAEGAPACAQCAHGHAGPHCPPPPPPPPPILEGQCDPDHPDSCAAPPVVR